MKPTTLSSYVSNIWEATGWTTVYQSNTTIAVMGWVTFQFTNAFFYDGTNNLMIDFSFRNTTGSSDGSSRVTSTSGDRLLFRYGDTSIGDPLTWSGSTPTADTYPQVSDRRVRFRRQPVRILDFRSPRIQLLGGNHSRQTPHHLFSMTRTIRSFRNAFTARYFCPKQVPGLSRPGAGISIDFPTPRLNAPAV